MSRVYTACLSNAMKGSLPVSNQGWHPHQQPQQPQGYNPFAGGQQPPQQQGFPPYAGGQPAQFQQPVQGQQWQQPSPTFPGQLQAPSPGRAIPRQLFPAGVGVLFLLSLAASFLRVYTYSASVQGNWVETSRNLWGYQRTADSSGRVETGFKFDLVIRGLNFSEWLILPLATSLVLLSMLALVALATIGERSWKTAVAGVAVFGAQLFVSLYWTTLVVYYVSENVGWERRIRDFGNPETSAGLGTWLWILLSLAGLAITVAELVRSRRAGEDPQFWGKSRVSSNQWIAAGVAAVCAAVFFFFSLSDVADFFADISRWNFGRFAGYGFALTVLAGIVCLVLKRALIAWSVLVTAHVWQVLWFFNYTIWTKNTLFTSEPLSQWAWLLTALVGLGAAVYGARECLQQTAVQEHPQGQAPYGGGWQQPQRGLHHGPQGAPGQW